MFEVYAKDYRITIQEIPLGNQGEDMARCLVIDITDAVDEFGSGGTVTVRNKRNGDEMPYMATNVTTVTGADATGRTHTYIKWTLTDVDTAVAGSGFVQADYIIAGVTVKTWVYKYFILPSLGVTGDVPDPYEDILEEITAQVAAVQAAAASAAASATAAEESATRIISTTQATVEDWLSEHIISGYAVDDTLSIRGAAADAAATGDLKRQIYSAFVEESASGNIASFTDGADDVPVKSLVVNITPKQAGSGDPSPSNVRAISGWTEANISRTGKNVFHHSFQTTTVSGVTFTANADGTIATSGTASGNLGGTFFYSGDGDGMLKPNTTYIMTGCPSGGSTNNYRLMVWVNGNTVYDTGNGVTFTTPDTITTVRVYPIILSGINMNGKTFEPMIRPIAFSDATYEPYNGNIYNVSFGSAGTVYGGTLDVTTGMLTVDRKMVTYDGSSDEDITSGSYGMTFKFLMPNDAALVTNPYGVGNCLCDKLKEVSQTSTWGTDYTYARTNNGRYIYFKIDSTITTVDGVRTYLGTNPISFVYPLANPISVQLSATEVRTLLGNNNIWSDTGSVASLEYRADTKLYLEKLTNPDNDMTADANIASGQYFMVNNTLYLATAAIASGATIVPGTNCTETSLAAALNAINA